MKAPEFVPTHEQLIPWLGVSQRKPTAQAKFLYIRNRVFEFDTRHYLSRPLQVLQAKERKDQDRLIYHGKIVH